MSHLTPSSEAEVEELIRRALAAKRPLTIEGQGTKAPLMPPSGEAHTLALSNLTGVLSYEPEELVISAWAGTPLSEIEAALAAEGQHLAFEPLDLRRLTKAESNGTIGGLIASGLSGPRRLSAGGVRDHVLGLSGVNGRGQSFKIGGRVVKNVTGYDLSKLLTGSWGTLAVMTRVTLKVLPKPSAERTLSFMSGDAGVGLSFLRRAASSSYQVSAAAMMRQGPDWRALVRLEGREDEIDERANQLIQHLGVSSDVLEGRDSQNDWENVKSLGALDPGQEVWRVEVPRRNAERIVNGLGSAPLLIDWAGARIWFSGSAEHLSDDLLLESEAKLGLIKGDAETWSAHARPAQSPALLGLKSRIRDAFDPDRILNPHNVGRG